MTESDVAYNRGFIDGCYALLAAVQAYESAPRLDISVAQDELEAIAVGAGWQCSVCSRDIDDAALEGTAYSLTLMNDLRPGAPDGSYRPAHRACNQKASLRLEKRIDLLLLGKAAAQFGGDIHRGEILQQLADSFPWMTD